MSKRRSTSSWLVLLQTLYSLKYLSSRFFPNRHLNGCDITIMMKTKWHMIIPHPPRPCNCFECVCVRACVRACVPACLPACVRACVRACVCVCVLFTSYLSLGLERPLFQLINSATEQHTNISFNLYDNTKARQNDTTAIETIARNNEK